MSRLKSLTSQLCNSIYFIYCFLLITCLVPVLTLISLIWWLVAVLLSYLDPSLGRFCRYLDIWMDENFVDYCPSGSIIATLSLTSQLPLETFRKLFMDNVIHARLTSTRHPRPRYPELRQFLTTFLGFRVWKVNPNFSINDHISEKHVPGDSLDLSLLHQELMNIPYRKTQSPWSVTLVHSASSTTVALRIHHVLTDGKSVLKLLTDCLAQKSLKSAQPSQLPSSVQQTLRFYMLYPVNYTIIMTRMFFKLCQGHTHPWTNNTFTRDKYAGAFVAFSSPIPLPLIKQLAKRHGVTTSSVIMTLITGAIRNYGGNSSRNVQVSYPLPKGHHPDWLTNHFNISLLSLPTHLESPLSRLQSCNEQFVNAKSSQIGKFTRVVAFCGGSLVQPLARKIAVNHFIPVILTNMAGDAEGFSLGGNDCTQFAMSVGTMRGTASATFCILSYKDSITVGISSKASVIPRQAVEQMANDVATELDRLIAL